MRKKINILNVRLKAFSLIEISFVLIIIGIILSYSMPSLLMASKIHKQKLNVVKMERVFESLGAYVAKYRKLPCPSTLESKGQALKKCSNNMFEGFLPYKDLGLSENDGKDAFNQPFIYAVETILTSFAENDLEYNICTVPNLTNHLKVMRSDNTLVELEKDFVAIVLLSSTAYKDGDFSAISKVYSEKNMNEKYSFMRWISRNNFIHQYVGKEACYVNRQFKKEPSSEIQSHSSISRLDKFNPKNF